MPSSPDFRTTVWTEIARAKADSIASVNRLLGRYTSPIQGFFKAKGLQPADADDLAQEVLRRIHESEVLKKADQEKGRFRHLLIAIARNVLLEHHRSRRAQKRGAGRAPLSLDQATPEGRRPLDAVAPSEPDEGFDHLWVANLVDQAMRDVAEEEQDRGTRYVEMLRLKTRDGLSYEELAERFGLAMHDVKNYLHRARKAVATHLWRLVQDYASSAEEYEDEVAFVTRLLGDSLPRQGG